LFIGTKRGLESNIIPQEGYELATIEVAGFERRLSLHNLTVAAKAMYSVVAAAKLIRRFGADMIIGTGGYVCGPVLLAGALLQKPTLIQEQNVVGGVTNKILSRFVDRVAVGYEEAAASFNHSSKVFVTGNPIRPNVLTADREAAYRSLGLDPQKKTILVSGGSRGARTINLAVLALHEALQHDKDKQILHVTGQSEYNNIAGILAEKGIGTEGTGNIKVVPYLHNMPEALACADLAIFRAGAIGLAELTAKGIPAILVPYPYAAENHQEFNARILEKRGAAVVIRDKELSGEKLLKAVDALFAEPNKLALMAQKSKELGRPQAAYVIADEALQLTGRGRNGSK
nr:undecaprenyldiphospho-muramoylpentapeptide beta-N-acetylglucosaminyltransferase [Sporomusaceae bacterium]